MKSTWINSKPLLNSNRVLMQHLSSLKGGNKNNAVSEVSDGPVEEKIGLKLKDVSHPKLQDQRPGDVANKTKLLDRKTSCRERV